MHRIILFVLLIGMVLSSRLSFAVAQDSPAAAPLSAEMIEKRLEGEFGADEIAATSGWVQSIGIVDWLGPLAPVALSPFFGVTCLSGLAIWGPDWVTDNAVRPTMGVILWGESPLYLVPVSFTTRQYTKCNSEERQYEARATAAR